MPSRDLFPRDWLVTGAYRDTPLGVLKTGKESEVGLVARTSGGRTTMLAEKRFKPRDRRSFQNNWIYRGVWGEGTRREHRAMKKNTRFGHEAAHARWIAHEWESLVRLHDAGATVPPPVELLDDGYLMAFIGDGERAAPRLSEVDLAPRDAARVWEELLAELAVLVSADRVHGDLSAFNVLWWRERAVLIDFSQTVDIVTHPAAHDLLRRDVATLGRYFAQRGVAIDFDRVL
ncbi:MAG TPA: RIO1 family regulatory kinase/ATPase, partial [Candidatus Limnocylindria bacterium]|nr:RIO1 family regulatory kinase/ATPase [Candidatus Limnocylindria bacterium]